MSVHADTSGISETRYKLESIKQSDDSYVAAILADQEVIYVRYIRRVTDPGLMTVGFQDCLILAMALVFSISVAKSNELHQQIAVEYDSEFKRARTVDGIEDQIDQVQEGSWSRARRGRWTSSRWGTWP